MTGTAGDLVYVDSTTYVTESRLLEQRQTTGHSALHIANHPLHDFIELCYMAPSKRATSGSPKIYQDTYSHNNIRSMTSSRSSGDYYSLESGGTPQKKRFQNRSIPIFRDLFSIKGIIIICLLLVLVLLLMRKPNIKFDSKTGTVGSFARLSSDVCSSPFNDQLPNIQYALVLDAGSTGSRIHVYRFNYCHGKQPTLEDEIFQQLKPGLSSYENEPSKAADSLEPLLQTALDNVPPQLHHCTPITLKATAGLRMLKEGRGERILEAVRAKLESYPFNLASSADSVAIMDGKDEGVYAWITVNYLLKKIGHPERQPTAAILDLGGGSTQIVFEPEFDGFLTSTRELPNGNHRYDLTFSGYKYILYQHSYDGYGLMQGRKKVLELAAKTETKKSECLREGSSEIVETTEKLTVTGSATSFRSCENLIAEKLFEGNNPTCTHPPPLQPCSFSGVFMPALEDTFISNDMYAFSYFYDMYAEPFNSTSEFRVGDLKRAAERVCSGAISTLSQQIREFADKNPKWCLDLGFMFNLLHVGYDLPRSRVMKTAKKINGIETGWSLGAAIRLLDELLANGKEGVCRQHY